MNETRALRQVFKESHKKFRKEIRDAEKAWALTHGVLHTCQFTIVSIKISDGALKLLMNKLSKMGTALAFKAELLALEKGKKSIDKRTMKTILDSLDEGAEEVK